MSTTFEPEIVEQETPVKDEYAYWRKIHGKNRFGPRWRNILRAYFGSPSKRRLARGALMIDQIRYHEGLYSKISDDDLKREGLHLRGRARGGEPLINLLPEVFGLCCVASWRFIGLRPFDVQLVSGVVMHEGALAKVATGEGKTLVATLPTALNALVGKGAHVTTVNDYLAKRDAEFTSPVFSALGLKVGILQGKMEDDPKSAAYRCDITYGTASEFGFDFLRDRLKLKGGSSQVQPFWSPWITKASQFSKPMDPKCQREHHFVLVDEADNIFVDEARTPLIIANPVRPAREEECVVYRWADGVAKEFVRDKDFFLDEKKQKIELTEEGRGRIRYSKPPYTNHAMDKLHEHIERALHAYHRFKRDQHYLIDEDKIVIIDEATGRPQPDRHWQDGLHQAVEAKEGVQITIASDHAAQITYQAYFKLYKHLCGMTGTAAQNFWELRKVYRLWVVPVPTNRACIREAMPDRVFPNEDQKWDAIVDTVREIRDQGRPILIGTRTVDRSEILSKRLLDAGIPHQVLNAKPDKHNREADIIAQAGRWATVTIATNMAGRGTDILLGGNPEALAWNKLKDKYASRLDVPPEIWRHHVEEVEKAEKIKEERELVRKAGGLHVIATERHEAQRIDRQLIGRAARQGDPGSCQFFLSLEDGILGGLGEDRQEELEAIGKEGKGRNWQKYLPEFNRAQQRLEKRHYRQRVDLMNYEKQRQEILKDLGADPYVD